VIDARLLAFPKPRGPEATELNQLISRSTELASKVDELERQQRATHTDVAEASNDLEQLERRSLGGQKVSDAQRRRAEEALAKARAAEQEPWVERVRAAGFAVQDAEQSIRAHVAENLDKLLAELTENAQAAASGVDETAAAFLAAVEERTRVEQATAQLASLVRPMRPGDISRARSDAAALEVGRFVEGGPEVAPILRFAEPASA
jgi:uncharacterized NAD(P)/FAD-binding protein YdhS